MGQRSRSSVQNVSLIVTKLGTLVVSKEYMFPIKKQGKTSRSVTACMVFTSRVVFVIVYELIYCQVA